MEDFYTISEAKNKLTSLIHRVEKGPAVKLTRHGRPVAVLLSLREYESISRKGKGFWQELTDLRQWMKREGIALAEEDFKALRDDTPGRRIDLKEIQNNLSRFLAGVKAGEAVVITERGRPIARIVKEPEGRGAVYSALSDLVEKGIVVLPGKSMDKEEFPAVETSGKPVSEMVVEDRR